MIQMVQNIQKGKTKENFADLLGIEQAKRVKEFHESFAEYSETPLVELKNYAKKTGVAAVFVKDESYRFGLNAFKVLGGSYAIGMYQKNHAKDDEMVYISATDGNHGRGVAWMAHHIGRKSVILMPRGSADERLLNIRQEGAEAFITEGNYDETVRMADQMAKDHGWVMVQDTAWEGYTDIPTWIMQGYMTMAYESYLQLNGRIPSHIFIQAGVGSVAGAVIGFYADLFRENTPLFVVVEPDKADCLYRSAKAADGERRFVAGDMDTIMAGLACGEPNIVSWEILKEKADYFMSCSDYMAAQGMRILGCPLGDDTRIIAGESGASAFGMVSEILRNPEYEKVKQELQLNAESTLLFFNTEGATDEENYRRIVWDGAWQQVTK